MADEDKLNTGYAIGAAGREVRAEWLEYLFRAAAGTPVDVAHD